LKASAIFCESFTLSLFIRTDDICSIGDNFPHSCFITFHVVFILLSDYADEGEDVLNRTVTGDE
jgi:hypothetical protein